MNAPDSPPTLELAIAPPFLTASVSSASAAVVPGAPVRSTPISSRMSETESPTAGVGARLMSTMPKVEPRRRAASRPTSSPMRVILKAVRLTVSATASRSASGPKRASIARTTPGPLTPTLTTVSGSPIPMCAPATKGLSSTALQKHTSFAHPSPPFSAVARAVSRITSLNSATAFMLMPALELASETLEHTCLVSASARGIDANKARSQCVKPF
jgi:hypothetical protein